MQQNYNCLKYKTEQPCAVFLILMKDKKDGIFFGTQFQGEGGKNLVSLFLPPN